MSRVTLYLNDDLLDLDRPVTLVCDGVEEELLRVIASNRDWTKNYQIKQALVTNPKTPQPQAIKFINYLQDKDLRSLMKSKDVSNNISAQARRILTKKGKI